MSRKDEDQRVVTLVEIAALLGVSRSEAKRICKRAGKQYGITYYSDYMAFIYNADMLAKAGIKAPPATWAELVDQAMARGATAVVSIARSFDPSGEKRPGKENLPSPKTGRVSPVSASRTQSSMSAGRRAFAA